MNISLLLAQRDVEVVEIPQLPLWYWILVVVVSIATIVGMWKVFEKAGKPGWASIIPIYNLVVLLEIAGMPLWWIILFFIPCVNIIPAVMLPINVAKKFGKDTIFAIILLFFPYIGYMILGFGDARYQGGTTPAKY